MIMIATVVRQTPQGILVTDISNGDQVQVNLSGPARFAPGDRVRITYNGVMTRSIPPQITAESIQNINNTLPPMNPLPPPPPNRPGQITPVPPGPEPIRPPFNPPGRPPVRPPVRPPMRPPVPPRPVTFVRGLVLQAGRNSFLIWNLRENRLMQVETPLASQFRVGQLVNIGYDAITLGNPPRINALSVSPVLG